MVESRPGLCQICERAAAEAVLLVMLHIWESAESKEACRRQGHRALALTSIHFYSNAPFLYGDSCLSPLSSFSLSVCLSVFVLPDLPRSVFQIWPSGAASKVLFQQNRPDSARVRQWILNSSVAADQKRSQPRCPFSHALRDMFQLQVSNHSSCPFT